MYIGSKGEQRSYVGKKRAGSKYQRECLKSFPRVNNNRICHKQGAYHDIGCQVLYTKIMRSRRIHLFFPRQRRYMTPLQGTGRLKTHSRQSPLNVAFKAINVWIHKKFPTYVKCKDVDKLSREPIFNKLTSKIEITPTSV